LFDILQKFNDHKGEIITPENIEKLIAARFSDPAQQYRMLYGNDDDYAIIQDHVDYLYNMHSVKGSNMVVRTGTNTSTGYVYLIDYLIRINGISPTKLYQARQLAESKNIFEVSTFEQEQTEDLLVNHINKHTTLVYKMVIDAEKKLFSTDPLHDSSKKLNESEPYLFNALFIRGELATGKTQQIPQQALLINSILNKEKVKVLFVHKSEEGVKLGTDSISNIGNIANVEINGARVKDFLKGNLPGKKSFSDYQLIIVDEASLLKKEHLEALRAMMSKETTVPIAFMGDLSQMLPIDQENKFSVPHRLSLRSIPIIQKWTQKNPALTMLTNYFNKKFFSMPSETAPRLYMEEINDSGKVVRHGVKYYGTISDVVEDFIGRVNSASMGDLVFFTTEDIKQYLEGKKSDADNKSVQKLFENGKLRQEYKGRVFILYEDVTTETNEFGVDSIQGLRRGEVYLAMDVINFAEKYPEYARKTWIGFNAGYTAVGRAKNFFGLVGPVTHNLTTKPSGWFIESAQKISAEEKKKLKNEKQSRYASLVGVNNMTDLPTSETPPPVTRTIIKKDYKKNARLLIQKGEFTGKLFLITQSVSQNTLTPETLLKGEVYDGKVLIKGDVQIEAGDLKKYEEDPPQTDDEDLWVPMEHSQLDLGNGIKISTYDTVSLKTGGPVLTIMGFMVKGFVFDNNYAVLLNNGDLVPVSDLIKSYSVSSLVPGDSDVSGDKMYSYGAKMWEEKNRIRATLFSVFSPGEAFENTTEAIRLRDEMSSVMDKVFKGEYRTELVYLKEARLFDGKNSTWKDYDHVLAIKLLPATTIENLDSKSAKLLSEHPYILALADTETDFNKTIHSFDGNPDVVVNGFDNSPYRSQFLEMNRRSYRMRQQGYESGKTEFSFGEVSLVRKDYYSGYLVVDKTKPISYDQFRENITRDPLKASLTLAPSMVLGRLPFASNNSFGPVLKFSFENISPERLMRIPNAPVVVFHGKNISSAESSYLTDARDFDKSIFDNFNKKDALISFNKLLVQTNLFQLLISNRSIIQKNLVLAQYFSNWVNYKGDFVTFNKQAEPAKLLINSKKVEILEGGKGVALEMELFNSLWKDILNHISKTSDLSIALKRLHVPIRMYYENNQLFVDPKSYPYLETYVQDVHYSGMYVPVNSGPIINSVIDEFDQDIKGDSSARGRLINNRNASYEVLQQALGDILGDQVWEQVRKDGIVLGLFDKHKLYGFYHNGRLGFNAQRNGVRAITIKHEIFHFVYDTLPEDSKKIVLKEAKLAMKNLRWVGAISDIEAEEWLSRKYGRTIFGTKYANKYESPWYTPKGILERFIHLLDTIYDKLTSSRFIDDLFTRIDRGDFKNVTPVHEADIFRADREDDALEDSTFDQDDPLYGTEDYDQEFDNIYGEEGAPSKIPDESYLSRYSGLSAYFGTPQRAKVWYRRIQHRLMNQSYFSMKTGTPGFQPISIDQAIDNLLDKYSDEKERDLLGERYLASAGKVNELYRDRAKRMNEIKALPEEQRKTYEEYVLYNDDNIKVFIAKLFPGYDVDRRRWKRWNQTSTQYGRLIPFSPEEGMTDQVRAVLSSTPKITWDYKDGRWSRQRWEAGEDDFINIRDTEHYLYEIGNMAYRDWRYKDSGNLFESFISYFTEYANGVGMTNERSNNLKSVLFRLFDGQGEKLSLYQYANDIFNKRKDNKKSVTATELKIANEIMDFLTAFVTQFTSYENIHSSQSRVTGRDESQQYRFLPYDVYSASMGKQRLKDSISKRMFNLSSSDFNQIVYDKLRGNPEKRIKKTFEVTGDGLTYKLQDGSSLNMITVNRMGKEVSIKFTNDFLAHPSRMQILDQMQNLFGLNNLRGETLRVFMEDTTSEAVMDQLKAISFNYPGNSLRDFFAETMMTFFWTTESHLDFIERFTEIRKLIEDGKAIELTKIGELLNIKYDQKTGRKTKKQSLTKDVVEKFIEGKDTQILESLFRDALAKNQKFYDHANNTLSSYPLKHIRLSEGNIDALEELGLLPDEELSDNGTRILKPTDFYVPLTVFSFVDSYIRGNDAGARIRRPDNSVTYVRQLRSLFSTAFQNGSYNIVSEFKTNMKNPEFANNTVFYDPEGGEYTNMMHAEIMTMQRNYTHHGLRYYSSGALLPSIRDVGQMSIDAFVQGLKERNRRGEKSKTVFYLPNIILGGSQDILFSEWTVKGVEPIMVEMDASGNIISATLNEAFFNKGVEMEFRRAKREMDMSVQRWTDYTTQVSTVEGAFIPPNELWQQGKKYDPVVYRDARWTLNPIQYQLLRNSSLYTNKDYIVKQTGEDGSVVIALGHATTFHYDQWENVYSWENYQRMFKNGKFLLTTSPKDIAFRDKLFESNYKALASRLSSDGHIVRPDIASLLDAKTPYYTRVSEKDNSIAQHNPIYKTYMYLYHFAGNAQGNYVFGHVMSHKDGTDKIKRARPKATGGHMPIVGTQRGLNRTARFITYADPIITDPVTGVRIEVDNGGVWGFMLYDTFLRRSFGDYSYGPIGKTRYKTVMNFTDNRTGEVDEHKKSDDFFSSEMFHKYEYVRQIQFDLLRDMDYVLMRKYGNIPSLYNKFRDIINKRGWHDATGAFEELADWITYDSGFADQIKNEIPYGFVPESVRKQARNRINTYVPGMTMMQGEFSSNIFHNDALYIILNPEQDISEDKQQSPPQQILQFLGFGQVNQDRMALAIRYQSKAFKVALQAINKEIGIDPEKDIEQYTEQDAEKVKRFMIGRGLKSMKAFSAVGDYALLMREAYNDENMVHHAALSQKLKQIFKNYVNREAIRITYSGVRFNQSSGWILRLFERDGVTYTFNEVEKEAGRILMPGEDVSALGFARRGLKDMIITDTGILPGEVVMPYIHKEKFGIKPNENINDAYTIHFVGEQGRRSVNVRGMEISEIEAIIQKAITVNEMVSINETPMFRTDASWYEWLTAFEESLKTIVFRVPSGGLPSGSIMRIADWISDYGNTGYIPTEMNARTNADQDIDQLTAFSKSIDSDLTIAGMDNVTKIEEGTLGVSDIKNGIFDVIWSLYSDVKNKDRIFLPITTSEIEALADEVETHIDNDFASMLKMYKVSREGSGGIGILAMSLAGMGYLSGLGERFINEHAKGFNKLAGLLNDTGPNAFYHRMANWLQVVLDNEKNFAIGRMHISKNALGIIGIMVTDGYTDVQIRDFFKNNLIRGVYDDVDQGENIDESTYDHNVFIAISDAKATSALNHIENDVVRKQQLDIPKLRTIVESLYDQLDGYLASKEAELVSMIRQEVGLENYSYDKRSIARYRQNVGNDLARYDIPGYERLLSMYEVIGVYETILEKMEGETLLDQLYDFAVRAEAIRRQTRAIKLRDGVPVVDYKLYDLLQNMPLYMGMSNEDFAENIEFNLLRAMDYFKNNSNEYKRLAESLNPDTNKMQLILEKEMDIYKALNIVEFMRATQFGEFFKYASRLRKTDAKIFLEDHPYVWDTLVPIALAGQKSTRLSYAGQYQSVRTFMQKYAFDYHAKRVLSQKDPINISVPILANNGEWMMNMDSPYARLDLSVTGDQILFRLQFPQFFDFLRKVIRMPEEQAVRLLSDMGFNDAEDLYAELIDNPFIETLTLYGLPGREYIRISDSYNMTDDRLDYLQRGFARLPEYLQDLFVVNQFLNTQFSNKTGSINEIVGSAFFKGSEGFAGSMQSLFNEWNSGVFDEVVTERLRSALMHEQYMAPFLKKNMIDDGFYPEVVTQKVSIHNTRVNVKHRLRKGHQEFNDPKDKYLPEYRLFDGDMFDISQPNVVPDRIVKFTAEETEQLYRGGVVRKTYINGHDYTYSSEGNDSGYYFTESGTIIHALAMDPASVTWKVVNESVLERILAKNISNELDRQKNAEAKRLQQEEFERRWLSNEEHPTHGINTIYTLFTPGVGTAMGEISKSFDIELGGMALPEYTSKSGSVKEAAEKHNIKAYDKPVGESSKRALSSAIREVISPASFVVLMASPNRINPDILSNVSYWSKKQGKTLLINPNVETLFYNITKSGSGKVAIIGTEEAIDKNIGQKAASWFRKFFEKKSFGRENIDTYLSALSSNKKAFIQGQAASLFFNRIREAFPQIRVIEEHDADFISRNISADDFLAYTDGQGVHINMDRLSEEVPLHELQHVFNKIAKAISPLTYQAWENEVKGKLNEDGQNEIKDIANIVTRFWNDKNVAYDSNKLIDEIIAVLGGISSVDHVVKFLNKHNAGGYKTKSWIQRVIDFVKRTFKNLWNIITRDLADNTIEFSEITPDTTLQEFFTRISDFVYGLEGVVRFSDNELEAIKKAYSNGNIDYLSNSGQLMDVKDIVSALDPALNINNGVIFDRDPETFIENLVVTLEGSKKNGKYTYHGFDKTLEFDEKKYDTREKLRELVKNEIVPKMTSFETSLGQNMANLINNVKDGDSYDDALDKAYGYEAFSSRVLAHAIQLSGARGNVTGVYSMMDLKDHPDLKVLYDPAFAPFNYVVLVHSVKNGRYDISIIDFTSEDMRKTSGKYANKTLLAAHGISDSSFRAMNGTYRLTPNHLRRVSLGLTIANMMKKTGGNLRVRNAGIMHIGKNHLTPYMFLDYGDLFNNIKTIGSVPAIMDKMSEGSLKDLFLDEEIFNPEKYTQSWLKVLEGYLRQELALAGNNDWKRANLAPALMEQIALMEDVERDVPTLKAMIRLRQAKLEEKLNLTFKEKYEQYVLSSAIRELDTGYGWNVNKVQDMEKLEFNIIAAHNLRDDVLQWMVERATIGSAMVKDEFIKQFNILHSLAFKAAKIENTKNPENYLLRAFTDIGSKAFDDMVKKEKALVTETITIKNRFGKSVTYHPGDEVEVTVPFLYMDKSDIGNKITQEQYDYAQKIWTVFRDVTIRTWLHRESMKSKNYNAKGELLVSYDDVAKTFDKIMPKGVLPVITKRIGEFIAEGKLNKAYERFMKTSQYPEEIFDEEMTPEKLGKVNNYFRNVVSNSMPKVSLYEAAGLYIKDGRLHVRDLQKNMDMSTNVPRVMDYYILQNTREVIAEKHILPYYNDLKAIYAFYEHIKKGSAVDTNKENKLILAKNMEYAEDYIRRLVHRRTADNDSMGTQMMNYVLQSFAWVSLAYKPVVGIRSAIWNEMNMAFTTIAESISNKYGEQHGVLPGAAEATEAHKLFFSDFKKMRRLALDFQVIMGSEKDLLENPFRQEGMFRGNIFRNFWGNITNTVTDYGARMIGMTMMMLKEGSWHAYIYDPKTDSWTYDIKRDLRYYNQDGTQTQAQKVLMKGLKDRLVDQNIIKSTEEIGRGHDWDEAVNRLKWYTDNFVIGAMDVENKWMVSNTAWGRLISTFRTFSSSKLFNYGVYGGERKSRAGSSYEAIQLEDGEWISRKELIDSEGSWQSIRKAFDAIKNIQNVSFGKWYTQANPRTRMNLARNVMKIMAFFLLVAISNVLMSDDEKRKFAWLYSDLTLFMLAADFVRSPFPLFTMLTQLGRLATGQGDIEKFLQYRTPAGAYYQTRDFFGFEEDEQED